MLSLPEIPGTADCKGRSACKDFEKVTWKVKNGYKVILIYLWGVYICWATRLFSKGGETTQIGVDHQISICLIDGTEALESYFIICLLLV